MLEYNVFARVVVGCLSPATRPSVCGLLTFSWQIKPRKSRREVHPSFVRAPPTWCSRRGVRSCGSVKFKKSSPTALLNLRYRLGGNDKEAIWCSEISLLGPLGWVTLVHLEDSPNFSIGPSLIIWKISLSLSLIMYCPVLFLWEPIFIPTF